MSHNPTDKTRNEDPKDKSCEQEDINCYKYILGEFGIQILSAIAKGARDHFTIMTLSGVPMACVKGRIPVLESLRLVHRIGENLYKITNLGLRFLNGLKSSEKT